MYQQVTLVCSLTEGEEMFKAIRKALRKLRATHQVVVFINRKEVVHYAMNHEDAMDWMGQYTSQDNPHVYESFLGVRAKEACMSRWSARTHCW